MKTGNLRSQLIRYQMENYRRNLRLIEESLEPQNRFKKYANRYQRALRSYLGISNKSELIRRVVSGDIVYHGDYHPLRQSQRCILAVLRECSRKRNVQLCLEMFHGTDQKWLDQYMAGELAEKEFLARIEYARKWAYPFENWRPLLQFCKARKIPVNGINCEAANARDSLRVRDAYAARQVAMIHIRHSSDLIYVVHGDYHVVPEHLPAEVSTRLKALELEPASLILHQNADALYWQLAREGREDADVLQIAQDAFCIMNTTPPNKLQSYLNWLELSKDAYFPVNTNWEDMEEGTDGSSIPGLVGTLCGFLDIRLPESVMDHLTIYYATDLNFMKKVQETPELSVLLPRIREKIKNNEGFLLEYPLQGQRAFLIYLANSSLNMAAEEATHFIHAVKSGGAPGRTRPFDAFYRNAIFEMIGFFGSKLINEKRRIYTKRHLREFLEQMKQQELSRVLARKVRLAGILLQHRKLERRANSPELFQKRFEAVYRNRSGMPRILSTQLGYMLGNKLYYAVKKGRIPLKTIRDWMEQPLTGKNEAFNIYLQMTRTLHTPRHKTERLW